MDTLRLPLTFRKPSYAAVVVPDATDPYYATLLANIVQMQPGELPISNTFGIYDPAFQIQESSRVVENAARYIPEIRVTNVDSKMTDSGDTKVSIAFERIS
jgi:hypothetical protein